MQTTIATWPKPKDAETRRKGDPEKNASPRPRVSPSPRRSAPGEGSAPLSNAQKAAICILAKDAWIAVGPETDLETWRHAETGKACGVESLCVAAQHDYLKILAHFQRLAGEDLRSAHSEIRAETGPRRTAWHKLREALATRQLPEAYAATICRQQFKCALAEASPKQLWCLVFTVRNRRKGGKGDTEKGRRGDAEQGKGKAPIPVSPRLRVSASPFPKKGYQLDPGKVFQKKPKGEEPF